MDNPSEQKKLTKIQIIKIIIATAAFLTGIFDISGVIDFSIFHGAPTIICLAIILWLLATEILKKRPSHTINFFRKMIIIAAVLEVTVFQLPTYEILFGGYSQKTIVPADTQLSSTTSIIDGGNGALTLTGANQINMYISDLNIPVGSVKVNTEFNDDTQQMRIDFDIADETHSSMRNSIAYMNVVRESENSNYGMLHFSGDVSQICIRASCSNDTDSVTIKSITFNETIPFHTSFFRFMFLSFVVTLAYGIVFSKFLKKTYDTNKIFCWASIMLASVLAVCLSIQIVVAKIPRDETLKERFELESGDQITQELVDAFENGQVELLDKPTSELLNIKNPYDWGQRDESGAYYKWDHVLYDGKYYSYYGIAPVLTLYLPYHMKTGHYLSQDMGILLFSIIGFIFLGLTYMAIVKRWFRNVPSGCILAGGIVILASCGLWFCVGRTLFYEISISSGFMYLIMGAYFLISSNILSNDKISMPRLALSSLTIGLSVLSRPTLAVYAICAAIFYVLGFMKQLKSNKNKTPKKSSGKLKLVIYVLCALIPIGALGILQMWYNYARFGSVFDFGIQYSLTINDFTHTQYHLVFSLICLFNYLFAVPTFSTAYPFISTPFSNFDPNGYYFSDVGNTSGILFLAFPTIGYMFGIKALKKLSTVRERIYYGLIVGLPCVIMPLAIMTLIWESGYAIRYTADFSWQIVIGALAILFFLYNKSKNETKKHLFRIFMAVSLIAAIIINGVQIFNFTFDQNETPQICRWLHDIIAFWR